MKGETINGLLITFEGQDGSGKSTLLQLTAELLRQKGVLVVVIPEFSNNVVGNFLRASLEKNKFLRLDFPGPTAFTETMYVLSDLCSQDESEIKPAIHKGFLVLKERHVDSIFACQIPKIIDDYPASDVEQLFTWLAHASSMLTHPNMTFFLDVGKELMVKRINARGEYVSKDDLIVFGYRQVIYDRLAKSNQARWINFPNDGNPNDVAGDIANRILTNLGTER